MPIVSQFSAAKSGAKPLQAGFSLIEVLVTILIVSFGMLGIAGMLFASINAGQVAMNRSSAVSLANEMADRVRSNWQAVKLGTFNAVTTSSQSGSSSCTTTCMTSICSPADQATLDICLWKKQIQKQLPGGQGAVTVDAGNANCSNPGMACIFTVTVSWTEANYKTGTNPNLALFNSAARSYAVSIQP
jgi:type IV pilus assembly protein PilV